MGRDVCPITSITRKKGKRVEQVFYGKMVSLQHIREQHLISMSKQKVLRETDVSHLDSDQCRQILRRNNGKPLVHVRSLHIGSTKDEC